MDGRNIRVRVGEENKPKGGGCRVIGGILWQIYERFPELQI